MNAYQDAVAALNFIASNHVQPETARQELEALKPLIDVLLAKIPAAEVDYETDRPKGA